MEKDLDKKLYNDYLNGEKQAFEYLYNKYKGKLQYFIFNIVRDYQIAEDLAQETFIYVMQNSMQEKTSFKYYIYLVARSKAYNYVNVAKRRSEIDEQYILSECEKPQSDISEIISKEETKKELLEAINELDEKYRNAVYLVNIEEMSYKETAKILGQTLSNTKSLVHRGKKQLRKILLEKGFEEMNKFIKVVIIAICVTALLTGLTYAAIKTYEFITRETSTDFENNQGYDYSQDMQSADGLYYKKITTYEQYVEDLKKWNELVEMSEDDFKEYFVIVIAGENYSTTGLYIDGVTADENCTYVDLYAKDKWDESTVMSVKVLKNLERDNIVIRNNPTVPNSGDEFVPLEEIETGYSIEEALEDGCIVIKYNEIISEDKDALDNFVEACNNGEDGFIRIYDYNIIENATVIDVERKGEKINIATLNVTQEGAYIGYNSGNEIIIINNTYILKDEIGNQKIICRIEK